MKFLKIVHKRKYLSRIFLLVTASIFISICTFSFIVYQRVEKNVFQKEYESNKKVLVQMKYNINLNNKLVNNLCLSLYSSPDVISIMYDKSNEIGDLALYLNRLNTTTINVNDYIHSIYIYNNIFKVNYSTLNGLYSDDKNLTEIISSYKNMPPKLLPISRKIQPYQLNGIMNEASVFTYFYYDSLDKDNQMDGALILNVKSSWLFDNINMINTIGGKSNAKIFIIDDRENFIEYEEKGTILNSEEFKKALMKKYKASIDNNNKEPGFFTDEINEKKYLITYLKIENINWVMLNVQDYKEVYKDINELRNTMLVITLIFLIAALAISATISGSIYSPFRKLLKQSGFTELNKVDTVKDGDEISFLNEVYLNYRNQLDCYKKEKDMNRDILKKFFLRKLLIDSLSFTDTEITAGKSENEINLDFNEGLALCIIQIDNYKVFEQKNNDKDKELYKFAIINSTNEIIARSYKNEPIDMKTGHIAIIISIKDEKDLFHTKMSDYMKEAQDFISKYFGFTVSVTISDVIDHARLLSKTYSETISLSQYRFISGKNSIIIPTGFEKNRVNQDLTYSPDLEKKLVEQIKCGNVLSTEHYLSCIINEVSTLSYNNMMFSLVQLTNSIHKSIEEINHSRLNPICIDVKAITNRIMDMESMDEFIESIMEVIRLVNLQAKSGENEKHLILVEAIKEITGSNYHDPGICTQQIASMLKLSSFHIRDIFKAHTNMSISEYINDIRLEKSIEWLNNSNLSIGEVMKKVGLENESYFYKLFKKKYGTTPKQYVINKALKEI